MTVQGNDITNSGGAGIRIVDEALVNTDEAEIHFNRLVGNDDTVGALRNEENGGEIFVDATNNWWGCNEGPELPEQRLAMTRTGRISIPIRSWCSK